MICVWFGRLCFVVFFFKQKTAYEMRISDWSSDVCSSDLGFQVSTCSSSRCCARPTTPTAAHWRTKSGNRLTTSKRMILVLVCRNPATSEFRIPVHHHAPCGQVHRTHIRTLDERNQPPARTVPDHHDVVGTGGEQLTAPQTGRAQV